MKEYADRILICDPNRNKLLNEGPKTDKIDATKLVQLLKARLMEEVYQSTDVLCMLYLPCLLGEICEDEFSSLRSSRHGGRIME
ncbi:hypothetical protein ACFL7M_07010 [Thermodesulfobacteriota bacterium]